MKIQSAFVISMFLMGAQQAGASPSHTPPQVPETFNKLRSRLEGSWKGHSESAPKDSIEVKYSTTSGGTALVEQLFAGTKQEMTSIYHPEGNKLAMTHFCMMGNQPHLSLKKSDEKTYEFDFVPTAGIDSKKDGYMGKVVLEFKGTDELKQSWTFYEGGKVKETSVFVFKKS
jgi:hypothetical protein